MPAFVIAFRKCLTVLINIIWFGHLINWQQLFGIGFVSLAVMMEVYFNQKGNEDKNADFQKLGQSDTDRAEDFN